MATITDFEQWLDENVDGNDYIDVYSVYCTVNEGMGQGGYEIKKNQSNGRLFVTGPGENTLMIASDKAKEAFLKMIEDRYCEDMDIEGYYAFHHAMEKDD